MTVKSPVVLLVEDNPADAMLLTTIFEMQSFAGSLVWVKDGEEALDYLLHRAPQGSTPTPDLVLLDLNLPRVTGLEVLRKLRATHGFQDLPVVVLTTSSSDSDRNTSIALGVRAFLTKPPDLDDYEYLVRRLIDVELGAARKA